MKSGKLLLLAIVAIVLVALAIRSNHQQQTAPPSSIGKRLLPGLVLDSVSRVEIAHTGAPIAIVRKQDTWTVQNLFDYPADLSKLQSALLALSGMKVGEVARGVNIDTNATLVDLQGASGKPLATLRLGSTPSAAADRAGSRRPQGRYVAVAGDPQVYLVKEPLSEFDGAPRDWANRQLLSLSSSDIQSIELSAPTSTVLTLVRDGNAWKIDGLSTNEELDTGKSYGVESALCYLTFSDVADPKLNDATTGLNAPGMYHIKLKNGDQYTARIGSANATGDRYLRLEAQLAPPGTNATAQAEYATHKADLEQKFNKWTYLVASSTAENMLLKRADLIKPKAPATGDTASTSTPVAPNP